MKQDLEPLRATSVDHSSRSRTSKLVDAPSHLAGGPVSLLPHSAAVTVVGALAGSGVAQLAEHLSVSTEGRLSLFLTLAMGLVVAGRPWWRRRRLRRVFERAPALSLADARRGDRVRVSGRAHARQPPFLTPMGREALVARYLGTFGRLGKEPGRRVYWELHGQDFDLVLADGTRVWVQTEQLVFLPDPPPLDKDLLKGRPVLAAMPKEGQQRWAWIYAHEVIGPGDPVQVMGTFDWVVSPAGEAGFDRRPRMIPVLVGEVGRPVCVSAETGTGLKVPRAIGSRISSAKSGGGRDAV